MKVSKKETTVKGYGGKKHKFEIETTEIAGYTFISLKKNGNPILKCTPEEFIKLEVLFKWCIVKSISIRYNLYK